MSEHDDTETESYRVEQGKSRAPDPRERLGEVPIAPSSAGVVGRAPQADTEIGGEDASEERGRDREAR